MRDRASINDVAMRTIKVLWCWLLLPHTRSCWGKNEYTNTPRLQQRFVLTKSQIVSAMEDSNRTVCTFLPCYQVVEPIQSASHSLQWCSDVFGQWWPPSCDLWQASRNPEQPSKSQKVAYEQLSILYASVSTQHYPKVVAAAKAIASGNPTHEQQLVAYVKACVEPA
jgi:hypothetical protein